MSALSRYTTREDVSGLFVRSVAALSTTPGVRFAGVVSALPLSGLGADLSLEIEDRPTTSANTPLSEQVRAVGGDYFQAMGIRLIKGRLFDSRDASDRPRAAIVSALTARKYWGEQNALGKRFRLNPGVSSEPWTTVVGVVGDIRNSGLDSAWVPMIYVPASQLPERSMAIVARLEPGLSTATGIIAAAVRRVDPDQPVFAVRTMREWLAQSVAAQRFSLALLSVFAVLAIVLAAVGVYAVMAFEVARRTRELGIRLALGARPGSLWRLVIGRSLTIATIGVLLGTAAGGIVVTLFGSMFFNATRFDALVFSFVPISVLVVALVAASVPARRAMRVEPLVALRTE
jgi:putative ABC transport system permease protein